MDYSKDRRDWSRDKNESFSDRPDKVDHDSPPFSRLFVLCPKDLTSEGLREYFEEFGTVEDVWIVKDRATKASRGVAYIKFSKMSEATLASEKMNGKLLRETDQKAIKVIIAQPKSSNSKEDFEFETTLTRLFICVPRDGDEESIKEYFSTFGEIDYVQIIKDRNSGEKKPFGYVRYHKAFDAAKAMESADKVYRAVIAEAKNAKMKREHTSNRQEESGGRHHNDINTNLGLAAAASLARGFSSAPSSSSTTLLGFPALPTSQQAVAGSGVSNRLTVHVHKSIVQEDLGRLFDLIPGMEFCDLKKDYSTGESKGMASVVYNAVGSAIYAKEKMDGFGYPPNYPLSVQYAPDSSQQRSEYQESRPESRSQQRDEERYSREYSQGRNEMKVDDGYGMQDLPPAKPLAEKGSECAMRLFIVMDGRSMLEDHALTDIFSRFGDLIDAYKLRNKSCGYARYASEEPAKEAIALLHGITIKGVRLKVLEADPPPRDGGSDRKRPRT